MKPYSYRDDDGVPDFDDAHPLIVFDGVCVLCSGFVRWVWRHDHQRRYRFATAQSALGQALYRHYGYDDRDYETNLVIDEGRLHVKLGAFTAVARRFGWPWRALVAIDLLPGAIADAIYDAIARNRYALFGKRDFCALPDADMRERTIE